MSAWVKFLVSRSQMRVSDVRVNLRRRNVGVSEHLLHRTNIGAILNQMRGETMAQSVRRNILQTNFCGVFFDKFKNRLAVYRLSRETDEDIIYLDVFLFAPDD